MSGMPGTDGTFISLNMREYSAIFAMPVSTAFRPIWVAFSAALAVAFCMRVVGSSLIVIPPV